MSDQLVTIGLLMLFASILPGPDFALVTKNTVLYSRRSGIYTAFGISCAVLIHIAYCGLGLAIVKKIVEDHKGQINLENIPGSGAKVTLSFLQQCDI